MSPTLDKIGGQNHLSSTFIYLKTMLWTRGASLLLASAIFQISSANFWVSPSGNDYADGQSASTPLQTLTEAQKRVRGVNLNMSGDLHVYLEPGTYHLTNPLVFTSEDSGSNGHQIVWQATDIPAGVNISGGYASSPSSVLLNADCCCSKSSHYRMVIL